MAVREGLSTARDRAIISRVADRNAGPVRDAGSLVPQAAALLRASFRPRLGDDVLALILARHQAGLRTCASKLSITLGTQTNRRDYIPAICT
jgi:hypothetical protein